MKEDDLLIVLANGMAVALEMSYDQVELRELWSDELEALRDFSKSMKAKGLTPPAAVTNVLKLADE